ncbi:MAG: hypothetical protein WBX15_10230 [Thermoanaerobaculia bacterium]
MILLLLLLAASPLPFRYGPAHPTVGDPISIEFPAGTSGLQLERSSDYEVVRVAGRRAVVRTFKSGNLVVRGSLVMPDGSRRDFGAARVPVRSVLEPKDDLHPAPMSPPVSLPRRWKLWAAVGSAALLAIVAWLALGVIRRRETAPAEPPLPPDDRLQRDVERARTLPPGEEQIGALADAARQYLAAVVPGSGLEMTTRETVDALRRAAVEMQTLVQVQRILASGDLAKFSPWGSHERDFESLAAATLSLAQRIPPPGEEEVTP